MIRNIEQEDISEILNIYQAGINTGIATFETTVPNIATWHQKYHSSLRFLYEENQKILGWISITPISSRATYQGVGEVSVYILPEAHGKGIATMLLQYLIEQAKAQNYWMLQSSIFQNNLASIQLHQKTGFRTVGIRKGIAQRNGQWQNTVIMEKHLILEF
ncbi:MAG: N-acetyltransferase family protein [Solibacillus sp.]|uniref:GNAT family N-acetyltransferase n=1 Tax=unclassified Solibacillus TaxID=2637870 RepID=UPI0030FB6C6A